MNEAEFRQELKKGLYGVYFFYGDEEYLKKFYGKRAQTVTVGDDPDAVSWNVYSVEGKKGKKDSANLGELEEAIFSVPMMSDKTLVKYYADFSAMTDGETEEFLGIVGGADTEQTVVIIFTLPDGFDPGRPEKGKPSSLYKKLEKLCKMVNLSKCTDAELRKWISRRLSAQSISISPLAADMLLKRSGTSMFALSGVLDKLAAYALANSLTEVDGETVRIVSSVNEEDEAFAMANAIMNGDRRKALKELHRCKDAREEPYAILAMVGKSLTDMLTVSVLMSEGMDKPGIAHAMKMHEYRAGLMMNAVSGKEPKMLAAAISRCRDADLSMKGAAPGYTALERFICTIPVGRRTN